MKHLMRDIRKLQEAFGHPVRTTPLSAHAINPRLNDNEHDLRDKLEQQRRLLFCLGLVAEEFQELLAGALGIDPKHHPHGQDIQNGCTRLLEQWDEYDYSSVETADALVDLMVVIIGLGLELGIPLDVVWAEVQRSNMAKVLPDGSVLRREDGKVLKPASWTPPDIAQSLEHSSAAWWPDERAVLMSQWLDPGKQDPFFFLLERYNQLENRLARNDEHEQLKVRYSQLAENNRQLHIALEALQSTTFIAEEKPSEVIKRWADELVYEGETKEQAQIAAIIRYLNKSAKGPS